MVINFFWVLCHMSVSIVSRCLTMCGTLLLAVFLLTGCASQEIVAHDLDEREANEIIVFLANRGIEATKEQAAAGGGGGQTVVKWNISVAADKRQQAMGMLSQAGLPRRQGQNLLDLFKESGLVPSEMQQKIRFQSGLSEQIASIIRKMDGVVDADVQLSFPEEDPLNPTVKKGRVTASVYVKHTGVLNDPNSHMISNIKWLVAGAVPGLSYDDVTVVPDLARYREGGGPGEEMTRESERPLVSIWSLTLAKDSLTRFRIVFFSFFVTILILIILLLLLIWKVLPVLMAARKEGLLLSIHRIEPEALVKKEEPKPVEDKKGKGKKKKKVEEEEPEDEEENEEEEQEDSELEEDDDEEEEEEEEEETNR